MTQRLMGLIGWKNAGKTTLMERLVRELTDRGFRISTVKHAHHDADIDQPGRDTYRHRQAGAAEVAFVTGRRWAIMHEAARDDEPTLKDVLARLGPADLILIEGFKTEDHPMIEVHATGPGKPLMAPERSNIVGIASDSPVPNAPVPVFERDNVSALADFILAQVGLPTEPDNG